jgi:hypothetical protein
MNTKGLLLFFLLISCIRSYGQTECNALSANNEFYTAWGSGETEVEAQSNARILLVQQLSTIVSSRTDIAIKAENNQSTQHFYNHSKSISNMRLDGLKFQRCESIKSSPKAKSDKPNITVLAYISKQDLQASAAEIKKIVQQYLDIYTQKKQMEIVSVAELYVAYLYTYLTPVAISAKMGKDSIPNIQVFLENLLRKHIAKLKVVCTKAYRHPIYPEEQIRMDLSLNSTVEQGVQYHFVSHYLSASALFSAETSTLDAILTPSSQIETITGQLELKAIACPENIKTIGNEVKISTDLSFTVNMKSVYSIDFEVKPKGNTVKLVPKIKNISVRSIEWLSDGHPLSNEQSPELPSDKLVGLIGIRVNGNDTLSRYKTIGKSGKTVIDSIPKEQPVKRGNFTDELKDINDFSDLQAKLNTWKNNGKAMAGKKDVFIQPDNCWVFLVNPQSKKVEYCLTPGNTERTDKKSNKSIQDFENNIKGFIAVWVEFY